MSMSILRRIKQLLDPQSLTTIDIEGYAVDKFDELGRGGFGTVYKAKSADGKNVAAKYLNTRRNVRIYTINEVMSFYKVPKHHENIVKICDLIHHQPSKGMWIMMEYCAYGDLDTYFKEHQPNILPLKTKVDIMIQTTNGLSFLHKNDIVHRDVKPGNILIQKADSGKPQVKLGDFGLSKFLDPNDDTSRMTSDVGTLSFKAPEFWKKDKYGKIQYHKTVDIFATGLTFLSMLQHTPGQALSPRVERSLDVPSESTMPIGLIMLQRHDSSPPKPALALVTFSENDDVQSFALKELIERMTRMKPKSRPSAATVLETLQHLIYKKVMLARRSTLVESVTNMYVSHCHDYMVIRKVQKRETSWADQQSVTAVIQVTDINGEVKKEMKDVCPHISPCLAELRQPDMMIHVAHACVLCKIIHVYNMDQNSFDDACPWGINMPDDPIYNKTVMQLVAEDFVICTGPVGALFAVKGRNSSSVISLRWQESSMQLVQTEILSTEAISGRSMYYMDQLNLLIAVLGNGMVTAIEPSSGKQQWQLPGVVLGRKIDTRCMTSDAEGRLYLLDGQRQPRLLIINPSNGNVLHVTDEIAQDEDYEIQAIGHFAENNNLIVFCQNHKPVSSEGRKIAEHKIDCYRISTDDTALERRHSNDCRVTQVPRAPDFFVLEYLRLRSK